MKTIPIVYGPRPPKHSPEYREMLKYESGSAEQDARKVSGSHKEPWLNVLAAYEPASPPALELALTSSATRHAVRGKVIDLGAGACWATARISKVPEVEEVVGLEYLLRHAGFKGIGFYPMDGLVRNSLKLGIRKILRAARLEDLFLSVTYVIHGRKDQAVSMETA